METTSQDAKQMIQAKLLYDKYKVWCQENGERNVVSSTKFGTIIGQQLKKQHTNKGSFYELPTSD